MKRTGGSFNRDSYSFEKIYLSYFNRVFKTCCQYSKNPEDAFDWTQDIMLKIAGSISGFEGNSSISTWIFSITRNHCITQLARKSKLFFSEITMAENTLADTCDPDELDERRIKEDQEVSLSDYLARLPEKDRQMLELKYFRKYSIKALQDEYRLSASAVKMRLARARQKAGVLLPPRKAA